MLYIPLYSFIWKTALYIPIFQGEQEMLNSYLNQMLLISNMERHIGEAIRTVKDAVEFLDPVSNQPQKFPSQESSLEVLIWHMPATEKD